MDLCTFSISVHDLGHWAVQSWVHYWKDRTRLVYYRPGKHLFLKVYNILNSHFCLCEVSVKWFFFPWVWTLGYTIYYLTINLQSRMSFNTLLCFSICSMLQMKNIILNDSHNQPSWTYSPYLSKEFSFHFLRTYELSCFEIFKLLVEITSVQRHFFFWYHL